MNCWLIGVTLQCLGSNDLTFIQNRNALYDTPRMQVRERAMFPSELPPAPMNARNAAYTAYMRDCTAKAPSNITVIHKCIDGYRP